MIATPHPDESQTHEGSRGLGGLLHAAADETPDGLFLQDPAGATVTFEEAATLVARVSQRLRDRGLRSGERIGIHLPNGLSWPLCWLGVVTAGFVAVPINISYGPRDIAHVLRDAGVSLVIAETSTAAVVTDAAADVGVAVAGVEELLSSAGNLDPVALRPYFDDTVQPDTLCNLQYTSGTSGLPKACMLTHGYWLGVAAAMGDAFELGRTDRLLTAQPFSYMDPMWMVTMAMQHRVPLVILGRFSARSFWADVRNHRATVLYLLGSMPQLLLAQPALADDRKNSVRMVLCSAIPAAVHAELEQRWGAPWREVYGLTESGLNILAPLDDPLSVGHGLLGLAAPGWRAKVVDATGEEVGPGEAGELVVTGPTLMLGYWNRVEATATALRHGWFFTGDLAVQRSDGWFRLVGRLKDSIRRGGENIAASEVEEVIRELPEVRDCAVVGLPDELFGEEVKVHVEMSDGPVPADLPLLVQAHAQSRLASFKVPRYVDVWRTLPRTPSERIAKHKISEQPVEDLLVSVDLGQRGRKRA